MVSSTKKKKKVLAIHGGEWNWFVFKAFHFYLTKYFNNLGIALIWVLAES